ncbi:helix-turn-helix transcriptional regulator [Candidatus Woesebacteria bacterium]|nr:helix-turn-helix transcriptional regulator [Candidatus Woesebacteria bacterium]
MSIKNQGRSIIGKAIRKARKEVGLSQRDFAEALNVSDKTVSSYEVGRAQPSFNMVKKMSIIFHKPLSYFDGEIEDDDLDLQIKLRIIERELLEIKRILKKK